MDSPPPAAELDVVFAGAGEFGLPTLKALLARHRVRAVYTQPDRPAGRGRKLTPTPIGQFVLDASANLPLHRTADLNAESLPKCDVLVVIAFGQKIAEYITALPRFGAINLHASRLPRYRGAAPIHRAVLAGETLTGNSIIRLAPRMDAGAVLAMSSVPIGETETTGELHDRLAIDGADLVLSVLDQLAAGTAVESEQDHSAATVAKKISREQTLLDFAQPAELLARTIRGFSPWPGCRSELVSPDGQVLRKLTLLRARPLAAHFPLLPGTLTPAGTVSTGQGTLDVLDLQPEGARPMPIAAYRNGHPWPAGATLRPIL